MRMYKIITAILCLGLIAIGYINLPISSFHIIPLSMFKQDQNIENTNPNPIYVHKENNERIYDAIHPGTKLITTRYDIIVFLHIQNTGISRLEKFVTQGLKNESDGCSLKFKYGFNYRINHTNCAL